MASTYETLNRFELMADGEKNNTWGQIANVVFQLISELASGFESINCAGSSDVTLTATNGASDQARNAILKFTGVLTGNINVIIPAKSHVYTVWNATSGAFTLTVKASGGVGAEIAQGQKALIFCDGTDTYDAISDRDKIGKKSLWLPAGVWEPQQTNGCSDLTLVEVSANKPMILARLFDSTTAEYAQYQFAFPKSWNEGTITFQPVWLASTSNSDGVAWTMDGVSSGDNEAIDGTYGTAVAVVDNNQSTSNRVLVGAESAAITINGTPAEGDLTTLRIGRDPSNGSDNLASDAYFIGARLFITTNAGNDA